MRSVSTSALALWCVIVYCTLGQSDEPPKAHNAGVLAALDADGEYRFEFPMVVGPRYIPGDAIGPAEPGGTSLSTTEVPDADRITPPVAPPQTRAGHGFSLAVHLDAGLPVVDIQARQAEHPTGMTKTLPLRPRLPKPPLDASNTFRDGVPRTRSRAE